jgi:hypothetical protein
MSRMCRSSLGLALVLGAGLSLPATADDLVDRLSAIPGLTIVEEEAVPDGRAFFLTLEQPVDHWRPWKGRFTQRIALYHRDTSGPMVLYSGGYSGGASTRRAEVTRLVDGNQLNVEHRFFEPSRPDPADWRDLTIVQQAADDHHVVRAFRSIYSAKWLRTGGSKGGMQATYHSRFFPRDIDGLIAYSAPNDVVDSRDAYAAFLGRVGSDPECRARLRAIQREALLRRDEMVPMMVDQLGEGAWDGIIGSPERAFELAVVDAPFSFWQYGSQDDCALVPDTTATTEEIYDFFDLVEGFYFYTDDVLRSYAPYYYQAGTQLGSPTLPEAHLADLLGFPGEYVPRTFVPDEIEMPRFQRRVMPSIDRWVRLAGRHQMFVYGELDPWAAEPFRVGPHAVDSYVYVLPGGNHGASVSALPEPQRDEAITTIRRWAGLPPLDVARARALAVSRAEPDLDVVDRMRRRPH